MRRGSTSLAALLLLAACATVPEPPPPPESPEQALGATERYGPIIERQAMDLFAAEPAGVIPAGLEVTILSVEETQAGLFYNAELHVPTRRRRDETYVIYGQCAAADLAACASEIVAGARMLAKLAG